MNSIEIQDWLCLIVQFACLLFMVIRELRKSEAKNLLLILVTTTILALVQMQTLWMFLKFETVSGRITHINQTISLAAAKNANVFVMLFVIAYCAVAYRVDCLSNFKRNDVAIEGPVEAQLTYAAIAVWVLVGGFLLTALAGGIVAAISNPGQSIAGQTFLLILVSIGKVPLARKIALRRAITVPDVVLYGTTFSLLLINSRFLAAYSVVQLALVFHYRRKEASPKIILGLGAALVTIFIVFGLYRETAYARSIAPGFDTTSYIQKSVSSGDAFDWFYAKNVEGFAGLAGIMTFESDTGGINHDYGYSNLQLVNQLIPNNLRTDPDLPFQAFSEELRKAYPYHGSVVPSGLEASYAHFGVVGIIALGLLLGYLVMQIHRLLLAANESAVTASLVSVHVLSLVREMFVTATFFALGEIFIVVCYHKVLECTANQSVFAPESAGLPPLN